MLCGLSNISHLRMSHTLNMDRSISVYTRLSISQVGWRSQYEDGTGRRHARPPSHPSHPPPASFSCPHYAPQTRVQHDGLMVPPPQSLDLQRLLETKAPFAQVVRHPDLDNEHIVSPDALHEYIRATPLPGMMRELIDTVLAYTDTGALKGVIDLPDD